MPEITTAQIAKILHDARCKNGPMCVHYLRGKGAHHRVCQEAANNVVNRLEPIVGAENISVVVTIVLESRI